MNLCKNSKKSLRYVKSLLLREELQLGGGIKFDVLWHEIPSGAEQRAESHSSLQVEYLKCIKEKQYHMKYIYIN